MQFIFVHVWVPGGDRNSNFWMTKLYSIIKYWSALLNYCAIKLFLFHIFSCRPQQTSRSNPFLRPTKEVLLLHLALYRKHGYMIVQVHVQRYSRGLPSKRMTTSFYLVSTSKTFGDELLLNNNLFRMPTPPKCFSVGSCKDYVQYDTIRYDIIHYN